jgi:hypothetical protein
MEQTTKSEPIPNNISQEQFSPKDGDIKKISKENNILDQNTKDDKSEKSSKDTKVDILDENNKKDNKISEDSDKFILENKSILKDNDYVEKKQESDKKIKILQQNDENEDKSIYKDPDQNIHKISIESSQVNNFTSKDSTSKKDLKVKGEKQENSNEAIKELNEKETYKTSSTKYINRNVDNNSIDNNKIKDVSQKESLSENKDDQTSESDSDESSENEKENSVNNSIEFEQNNNPQVSAIDYKNLIGIEPKSNKKSFKPSNFYEKKITEKKEKEKKLEVLRKKMDSEVKKTMTKPLINPESKKIMEKKQGFVKPIYERAKEIEDTKKTKIETIKKTVIDKKVKEEEEVMKSKILITNKPYDEKEFSKWMNQTTEWQNKKILKIETEKERRLKQEEEQISKYYQPNIDKKEMTKSKMETNIYDKLYSLKDEKKEKMMQKILESIPDFKPQINKKVPKFIQNKKELPLTKINNFNNITQNNVSKTPRKSSELPNNYLYGSEKMVCNTDRIKRCHALSMNYYSENNTILSENEASDDEVPKHIGGQDEIINQYKQALEITKKINMKHTLRISEKK